MYGRNKYFLLGVTSDIPYFWMYVAVEENATLKDFDGLLRDVWLECCGHLSAFEFENVRYVSDHLTHGESINEFRKIFGKIAYMLSMQMVEEMSMDVPVKDAFKQENRCRYVYDFGSSTVLKIRLLSTFEAELGGICLIARNELPEIVCDICGRKAERLCVEGKYTWLCRKHVRRCRGYARYRIVNSPRMGVCGYGA